MGRFETKELSFALTTDALGGDEALAAWLTRDNPGGACAYGAFLEGSDSPAATLVGLATPVWIAGEETRFVQMVRTQVAPEFRAGLTNPGAFVELVRGVEELRDGVDRVHFGWPDGEAWRVGKTLLEQEVVRTQLECVRELGGEVNPVEGVFEIDRFDHQARWLWERTCGPWGASTIRDDAWLNWRYVDRPDSEYTRLGVNDAEGVLRGIVVLGSGERADEPSVRILDWLVPTEEPEVGEALKRAACNHGRRLGARTCTALIPEWSPWFASFQRWGFLVHDTDRFVAARAFRRPVDAMWLRDSWWYQPGDAWLDD